MFNALSCPLDGAPLTQQAHSWRCPAGHCFDVAREGYLNLLPVQRKSSLDPGDSKEMVAARRRYLGSGFYQPIADKVADWALADVVAGEQRACLDAGCGEGFYLNAVLARAAAAGCDVQAVGLDISKWAVIAAAKAQREARWLVGTNAALPIVSGTLDRLMCLFGFPVFDEFARMLKSGGELLMVDAGPDHLRELREIIYPRLKTPRESTLTVGEAFVPVSEETLRFPIRLGDNATISDLLVMTPHLYRAPPEGRARAAALTALDLTVDVVFRRFRRV